MNGSELRDVISDLKLSQAEFARLLGVSIGAVSQWLSEARGIPGPVEAYVRLLMKTPAPLRELELLQLRKGNSMRNGMYLIHFAGSAGNGYATLTFSDGAVFGFDQSGALYDGTVTFVPDVNGPAVVEMKIRMPANIASVVGGVRHPFEWILSVRAKIDLSANSGHVTVETGLGPDLKANFTRMRDLPIAA
ncbi:helix-turn-helix domain-containing protein [Mesorhizobium amorphae]